MAACSSKGNMNPKLSVENSLRCSGLDAEIDYSITFVSSQEGDVTGVRGQLKVAVLGDEVGPLESRSSWNDVFGSHGLSSWTPSGFANVPLDLSASEPLCCVMEKGS